MSTLPGLGSLLDGVKASFEWGSPWKERECTFVWRHLSQQEDGSITVDQTHYVSEIATTRTSLSPETPLSGHPELISEFRSGIGSLQWMSGTTRGDISADTSLLQKSPKELTVGDLLEVNAVLKYVRATKDAFFRVIPIPFDELLVVSYGDSGFANAPGGKSQGGLVVVATDRLAFKEKRPASLLEWRSYRHQRVLRSTLAAEAASLDKVEDYGNFVAAMLSELADGKHVASMQAPAFEVVPVTDARSLWDAVHRLSTNFQEKRVEISVASLREQCRNLRWVPTEYQLADALTKRARPLRDFFRKWMAWPEVTLVESRSPEDISLPGEANASWRRTGQTGLVNNEE